MPSGTKWAVYDYGDTGNTGNPTYITGTDAQSYVGSSDYCGGNAVLPTITQVDELLNNTTWRLKQWGEAPYDGVSSGTLFTSNINGKQLYMARIAESGGLKHRWIDANPSQVLYIVPGSVVTTAEEWPLNKDAIRGVKK